MLTINLVTLRIGRPLGLSCSTIHDVPSLTGSDPSPSDRTAGSLHNAQSALARTFDDPEPNKIPSTTTQPMQKKRKRVHLSPRPEYEAYNGTETGSQAGQTADENDSSPGMAPSLASPIDNEGMSEDLLQSAATSMPSAGGTPLDLVIAPGLKHQPNSLGTNQGGAGTNNMDILVMAAQSENFRSQSTATNEMLYAGVRPFLAVDPLGYELAKHRQYIVEHTTLPMPDSTVISSEEYPGGANSMDLEPGNAPSYPLRTPHQPGAIIETDGFQRDYITDLYVSEDEM